jgi:hypothetical protein
VALLVLAGVGAADALFDPVKPGDAIEQVGGERRRARLVALEDLAAEVRPASDLLDATSLVQLLISGITVGLEKAGEQPQLALRMDAAAIGREPIPGERWGDGARRAIIDDIGPEPRLCGAALAGHEHRHRRIVGVELGGLQSFLADAADDGVEQMRGLARPPGEGGAIDVDALRRHHLCLAIEGQMMIELVHDDMGERGKASLAACDRLHRRRCLDDPVAGAAAILGPHGADHAPLDRGNVQLLVAVVAQRTQRAAAIGTGAATGLGLDPPFSARQMIGHLLDPIVSRIRDTRSAGALSVVRRSATSASPSSSSRASSSCSIWRASFSEDWPKVMRRSWASW